MEVVVTVVVVTVEVVITMEVLVTIGTMEEVVTTEVVAIVEVVVPVEVVVAVEVIVDVVVNRGAVFTMEILPIIKLKLEIAHLSLKLDHHPTQNGLFQLPSSSERCLSLYRTTPQQCCHSVICLAASYFPYSPVTG